MLRRFCFREHGSNATVFCTLAKWEVKGDGQRCDAEHCNVMGRFMLLSDGGRGRREWDGGVRCSAILIIKSIKSLVGKAV